MRKIAFTLVGLFFLAVSGFLLYPPIRASTISNLPPLKIGESSTIYGSDGSVLGHITPTNAGHPLTDDQVSPLLREAHLAAEDRTFYVDGAVSYPGMLRALGADVFNRSFDAGGSTIDQQYVKEAYLSADQTWQRKLNEATYANKLDSMYSKDTILTKYVNINYYGRGANGIEDGAQAWFGHSATTLTDINNPQQVAEAAFLAALVNQPSHFAIAVPGHPDQLKNRDELNDRITNEVLPGFSKIKLSKDASVKTLVSDAVAQKAAALVPTLRITATENITTGSVDGDPYLIDYVKEWLAAWQTQLAMEDDPSLKPEDATNKGQSAADAMLARGGGLAIHTSINPALQKLVAQAVAAKLPKTGLSSGVVIEDPVSGAVVAMYAGTNYAKDNFNYAFYANRQVGSTMKTVVLTDAVNRGVSVQSKFAAPAYVQLPDGTKVWNDNRKPGSSSCELTLADAIALSNNPVFTEAITGQMASCSDPTKLVPIDNYEVTPKSVADLAHKMGADDSLVPGASKPAQLDAVPSLALGTSSLTPMKLASIGSTLANDGVHTKPHIIESVAQSDKTLVFENDVTTNQVVSSQTANVVNQTLTGVFTKGTAAGAQVKGHPLAGKTGTTDTDAWMLAWSAHDSSDAPSFVCSAWAGYPDNRVTSKAGGDLWGADVARICQSFFSGALSGQPRVDFPKADLNKGNLVGLK